MISFDQTFARNALPIDPGMLVNEEASRQTFHALEISSAEEGSESKASDE
jgi:hypothetical protein